ncbi:hypothetical protein AVEN_149516-1 [Araneus ventricosus]|uniref:Uncharacterized protein n=1 Tax=Araneus ventricosus TaxID=182803 RepID=A0A4Y2K8M2_ARAVE|nr:hypothetical protein AVEN_149516-1 [Araneus ventricosus]
MSICTHYLFLDYFPTNSRLIFKESWLKMPALDWWKSSSSSYVTRWKRSRDNLHWTRSQQFAAGRATHFRIPLQEQEQMGESTYSCRIPFKKQNAHRRITFKG